MGAPITPRYSVGPRSSGDRNAVVFFLAATKGFSAIAGRTSASTEKRRRIVAIDVQLSLRHFTIGDFDVLEVCGRPAVPAQQ